MFIFMLELGAWAAFTAAFITQVFVPLWKGQPLFPFFRKRERLSVEVAEAREDVEDAELENVVAMLRQQATALRKKEEDQ